MEQTAIARSLLISALNEVTGITGRSSRGFLGHTNCSSTLGRRMSYALRAASPGNLVICRSAVIDRSG